MALFEEIKTLKADGLSVDEIASKLSSPAPYWLVKVIYNLV